MHVMEMIHSENNQNPPDRMNPDYDWLWKIRRIFDYLNNTYSTLYHPTENLALDEVIVKIKGRGCFDSTYQTKITIWNKPVPTL